jgi:aconitate hydratase
MGIHEDFVKVRVMGEHLVSTYIKEPPFFINFSLEAPPLEDIKDSRILALLGTSVTTDHISPAGAIPKDMPAGSFLL